jgi:hypothetical protein
MILTSFKCGWRFLTLPFHSFFLLGVVSVAVAEGDGRRPNTVTRTRDLRIGTGVTGTRPGPENARTVSEADDLDHDNPPVEGSRRTRQRTTLSNSSDTMVLLPSIDDSNDDDLTQELS